MDIRDLEGKIVVLTGTFTTMKRAEAEQRLKAAGATVSGSVSKKTQLLVHGADAGSKLAKAQSLGVPLLTEAELVALLGLEGASEALVAVEEAKSPVAKAVDELRLFVQALKKRADVTVKRAEIGRKASKADLAALVDVPAELVELYRAANGIHIEWEFVEPRGAGCMHIWPISPWIRFTGDEEHYMGFGERQEALALDHIQPEGNTWLVRTKGTTEAQIIFASAAEGADGVTAARSIADYLREAMRCGLVYYWPRCFRENRYVSYADQEAAIERFRAPIRAPLPVVQGTRVQFDYFSEGGRGEVLSLFEAAPSRTTEFCGRSLVQVRLDVGISAWLPKRWVKAVGKTDAYERLRDPAFDLMAAARADLLGLLADLARAIGPLSHYSSRGPSHARRAAGLLAARPLPEAISLVLALRGAVVAAGLDLAARRPLPPSDDTFSPTDFVCDGEVYVVQDLFVGLFGGLVLLALDASAREGRPGRALVDAALLARLSPIEAGALREVLQRESVCEPVRWGPDHDEYVAKLGLPEGASVLLGTGF
jgi:hypothetical protein